MSKIELYISAVKQLITIIHIQNKSFYINVYINYKYTYSIYLENIYMFTTFTYLYSNNIYIYLMYKPILYCILCKQNFYFGCD